MLLFKIGATNGKISSPIRTIDINLMVYDLDSWNLNICLADKKHNSNNTIIRIIPAANGLSKNNSPRIRNPIGRYNDLR